MSLDGIEKSLQLAGGRVEERDGLDGYLRTPLKQKQLEWATVSLLIAYSCMGHPAMNLKYDMDDESFSYKRELAGAIKDAKEYLHLWKRRALYSTVAFVLCCAAAYPFLYGHSLYVYWNSFGKYLVILSTVLLIPFVICVGIAINSWMYLRNLRREGF